MRHISVFILVTVMLPFSVLQTEESQTRQGSEAEQDVRKLERAWLDAYEQRDARAMNTIVAAFLDSKGLKVDDDYLVARYARIVDAEKRQELIIFYLENLRDLGFTRTELEQGGRRASEAEKTFNDFAARARQSFTVVDGKP